MTTQTQMITGVDFVTVPTQDYEKAKEFYGETLGLEFNKPWGDRPAGEWRAGDLVIAVMQMDAFGQEFAPHGAPIALQVDDVEASRKELEGKGVKFVMDTIDSGVCHMAYFQDPDGNTLLLHNRYAPKGARPTDAG
jgi:predicted enzyme related to lactoylglutathione lyase